MRQAAEEIENIFRVNVFSQMWLVNEFWEEMTKTAGERVAAEKLNYKKPRSVILHCLVSCLLLKT